MGGRNRERRNRESKKEGKLGRKRKTKRKYERRLKIKVIEDRRKCSPYPEATSMEPQFSK
jgi:hypothetical protein